MSQGVYSCYLKDFQDPDKDIAIIKSNTVARVGEFITVEFKELPNSKPVYKTYEVASVFWFSFDPNTVALNVKEK